MFAVVGWGMAEKSIRLYLGETMGELLQGVDPAMIPVPGKPLDPRMERLGEAAAVEFCRTGLLPDDARSRAALFPRIWTAFVCAGSGALDGFPRAAGLARGEILAAAMTGTAWDRALRRVWETPRPGGG